MAANAESTSAPRRSVKARSRSPARSRLESSAPRATGASLGGRVAAYEEHALAHALTAMEILADAGHAGALFNVGALLGQLERSEEAIGVYDEVVARFADAPEPALLEPVAMALQGKAEVEGELGAT